MKKVIVLFVISAILSGIKAQVINDSVDFLEVNQIKAGIGAGGMLFYDKTTGVSTFEYPAGSGKNTIFSSSLWVGGMCEDELYFAGDMYRISNKRDFYPGPIMDASQYPEQIVNWNKLWKINKSEIDYHINNWETEGYVIPESILEWPVYGDVSTGMYPIQAPFIDTDADGVYHPELGDYPSIRGDQAIYFIFNDSVKTHTQTYGNRMGLEVHGLAYAYNSDPLLEKTIFVNYLIYNRSDRMYDSVYVGNFTDVDLGFYGDDYVGCDTLRNSYFVYNGQATDEVYGENPPAQSIQFINQTMSAFVYFNNNASLYPNTSDPTIYTQFYAYMNARWKDGTRFTFGGDGYPDSPEDQNYCNYIFPGYPNDETQWNEVNAGNTPFDRRGLGVAGPFTLAPGEYIPFDLVFTTIDEGFTKVLEFPNVDNMLGAIDLLQTYFDNGLPQDGHDLALLAGLSGNDDYDISDLLVYPNPNSGNFTIDLNNQLPSSAELYNSLGQIIWRNDCKEIENNLNINGIQPGNYILNLVINEKCHRIKIVVL